MTTIPSYNLDALITPKESHAFLNDMWNPGYGQGQYFSALHELDEHMFTPVKVGDEWIYSPHALHDGFALLNQLNQTYPALKLQFSPTTPFPPPKKLKWMTALKSALSSAPEEKHLLLHQLPYDKSFNNELQFFTIELSEEETKMLNGVNLTSFTLEKISKFFMIRLSMNKVTRWMIPVNIRGPFQEAPLSSMSASYVGINCSLSDDQLKIKNKLVKKLKLGEQWGYWLMGKIGLLGGKKIILNQTIKSLNKKNTDWFASFSNLGNIGGVENSPALLILPIVRWHRPIGCVSYIYRNKLNLTVSFHPSLNITEEILEEYKNEIYQSIVST